MSSTKLSHSESMLNEESSHDDDVEHHHSDSDAEYDLFMAHDTLLEESQLTSYSQENAVEQSETLTSESHDSSQEETPSPSKNSKDLSSYTTPVVQGAPVTFSSSKIVEKRMTYDGRVVCLVTLDTQTDWDWFEGVQKTGSVKVIEARDRERQENSPLKKVSSGAKPVSRETISRPITEDTPSSSADTHQETDLTPFSLLPNDEFGIPLLVMISSSDESSDEESVRRKRPAKSSLPSVGPPQILKYVRESDKKELEPKLSQKLSFDAEQSSDTEEIPLGILSGSCEFCSNPILPLPTMEMQQTMDPENLFCCEEYKEFIQFASDTALKMEEEAQEASRKISIKVHDHHGSKEERKVAKEQAVERMRQRELQRRQQESTGSQTSALLSGEEVNYSAEAAAQQQIIMDSQTFLSSQASEEQDDSGSIPILIINTSSRRFSAVESSQESEEEIDVEVKKSEVEPSTSKGYFSAKPTSTKKNPKDLKGLQESKELPDTSKNKLGVRPSSSRKNSNKSSREDQGLQESKELPGTSKQRLGVSPSSSRKNSNRSSREDPGLQESKELPGTSKQRLGVRPSSSRKNSNRSSREDPDKESDDEQDHSKHKLGVRPSNSRQIPKKSSQEDKENESDESHTKHRLMPSAARTKKLSCPDKQDEKVDPGIRPSSARRASQMSQQREPGSSSPESPRSPKVSINLKENRTYKKSLADQADKEFEDMAQPTSRTTSSRKIKKLSQEQEREDGSLMPVLSQGKTRSSSALKIEKISSAPSTSSFSGFPEPGSSSPENPRSPKVSINLKESRSSKKSLTDQVASLPSVKLYGNLQVMVATEEEVRQMKTINYQLSSQKCLEEGWTVLPPSLLVADENDLEVFIPEPLHPSVIASGNLTGRSLIEKFYPSGNKFLTIFPDGTGNIFYPSGNLAIMISSVKLGHFFYIVLDDTSIAPVLAIFDPLGCGCVYYSNGNVRLYFDAMGGMEVDISGTKRRRWTWKDPLLHVHAPPFQPMCIRLNMNISIRLMTQESMALTFMTTRRSCRLSVGTRLKLVSPALLPHKTIDENQLFIDEQRARIDSILSKVSLLLKFPKSPKVDKILPPLSITTRLNRTEKMRKELNASSRRRPKETINKQTISMSVN